MGCRAFRSDVALWHSQHFESHHELPNGRRAKEWGIEVRMKMPFRMLLAVRGRLMKAHRIGEGDVKNSVVGRRHLLQGLSKTCDLLVAKIRKRSQVATAANEQFEWPHRPEGYQCDKAAVPTHHADLFLVFELDVIT